jgi:peptide methionine sulfoxide reductase MsrA
VGYAGGRTKSDKVCYYGARDDTVYDNLGHAEVVQIKLTPQQQETELREFARAYFKQFRKTPFGYIRSDPQDVGPGYRNVVGIPGGINSPLMRVIREENTIGMDLLEGKGGGYGPDGKPLENDRINTVYVLDSTAFPFYQAEIYHQNHNGLGGKDYGKEYRVELKDKMLRSGAIKETGCPEGYR